MVFPILEKTGHLTHNAPFFYLLTKVKVFLMTLKKTYICIYLV